MDCAWIVIFISLINLSVPATVTWLPSTSFNLPNNFNDGKLPCSKQTVVFPETLNGAVQIESGTSVAGFVLPSEGEIYIAEGEMLLGPIEDVNCTRGNVYYIESSFALWNHPDVWTSPKFNKATPDAERVPCFDDVVEFPASNSFTVTLPDKTQFIKGLKVGNESIYVSDYSHLISSRSNDAQQFILNQNEDTGLNIATIYCKSRSGCPCQKNVLEIECTFKFCPKPTCVDPIQPIGHCCKICGGTIVFDIDQSFDMMQFKELVERIVDSYGTDLLDYHIGRVLDNKVQLVVVDKNGYDQTSGLVVNAISYNMEKQTDQQTLFSGSPLDKSGSGGKIFISVFLTVALMMTGIYIYYYKLPQINYPVLVGRSQPGMFSRFNRRTESVVSLTRRDSAAPIGVGGPTAFRNPLYGSKRSNASEEESIMEE